MIIWDFDRIDCRSVIVIVDTNRPGKKLGDESGPWYFQTTQEAAAKIRELKLELASDASEEEVIR